MALPSSLASLAALEHDSGSVRNSVIKNLWLANCVGHRLYVLFEQPHFTNHKFPTGLFGFLWFNFLSSDTVSSDLPFNAMKCVVFYPSLMKFLTLRRRIITSSINVNVFIFPILATQNNPSHRTLLKFNYQKDIILNCNINNGYFISYIWHTAL